MKVKIICVGKLKEKYLVDGIHEYLKSQSNVDEKLLRKADSIERFISEIERKYESILKEK